MNGARAITINPRFCGPPHSGNGGYVAGLLASFAAADGGRAVEVTLRSPPPTGVRLDVTDDADGLLLSNGETLLAQVRHAPIRRDPPPAVTFDEAVDAGPRYAGLRAHPFPTCFVCGTERKTGDGMLLRPGVIGPGIVAAAWWPDESLASDGVISAEFAWAALDCPGGWATEGVDGRPMVLGRMTALVFALPKAGQRCVVVGQAHDLDGRKAFTSTALYSDGGELLAQADQVWLAVDPASVRPA